MRYLYLLPLLFMSLLISQTALGQNVAYVTNTSDIGNGSLRSAITSGVDSVIIDVAGTLNLQSPIFLNNNVVIIGPSAIHFTIDLSNNSQTDGFFKFNDKNLILSGVTITGAHDDVRVFRCNGSETIKIEDCLFEENHATSTTTPGSICMTTNSGSDVTFSRCSFINNSANYGGVFHIVNQNFKVYNCTFNNNSTIAYGGAISINNGASATLINNTFVNNDSGTGGKEIHNGGTLMLKNNIFKSNKQGTKLVSITSSISGGANFANFNIPSASIFPIIHTSSLHLNSDITTDGFGLKYFLFNSYTSDCIDVGLSVPGIGQYDARRSWRVIYGKTDLSLFSGSNTIDVGAIEYTPFIVTNSSATAIGSFNSVAEAFDNHANNLEGNHTIVFELPATNNRIVELSNPISISPVTKLIINGFSQEGSRVPGPKDMNGILQNGIMGIELDGENLSISSTLTAHLSNNATFFLSGISFTENPDTYGVNIDYLGGGYFSLEGNHIGVSLDGYTSTTGNKNGIRIGVLSMPTDFEISNIGKNIYMNHCYHNARNIISGNELTQITTSLHDTIVNNFIGLNSLGINTTVPMHKGIFYEDMGDTNTLIIGEPGKRYSNYFGNIDTAVYIQSFPTPNFPSNVHKNKITNNSFGFQFKDNSVAPDSVAIFFNYSDSSVVLKNQIGHCTNDAISINNSNHTLVSNNIIGVSKNNNDATIGKAGIAIYGSAEYDDPMSTGTDQLFNIGGHNLIESNFVYNCKEGIRYDLVQFTSPLDPTPTNSLNTFFNDVVRRNIIGIDTNTVNNHSGLGNDIGIYFGDSVQGVKLHRNIIALNNDEGITLKNNSTNKYIHILRNSIHDNNSTNGIGIDLGDNFPTSTPNTSNLGITPPVISNSLFCNDTVRLNLLANILNLNKAYKIEFFEADSDNQEGEKFIKDTIFPTSNFGSIGANSISLNFPTSVQFVSGKTYVATLTELSNETIGTTTYNVASTSEFSTPFTLHTFAPSLSVFPNNTVCEGNSVAITVLGMGNGTSSSLDNSFTPYHDSIFQNNNITSGTHSILITSDSLGCSITNSITIIANALSSFDIALTVDSIICEGDEVIFNFDSSYPIDFISWATANDNGVVTDDTQLIISNPTIGVYNLKPSIGECNFDFEVTLMLDPNCTNEVTINAFNPNSNIVENQYFNIDLNYINEGLENTVTIYNRWGDVIYKANNYDNKGTVWRGQNDKGETMMEATYFYTVEIPSKDFTTSGWVYLNK